MRRLSLALVSTVSALAFTHIASAADLPRKAPAYTPPPPPVYSWTGCYVGLNAGGVWGHMQDDWTPNPAGFPASGPAVQADGSTSMDGSGFTGGGQVGCNYQLNQFVLGAEADIQYTGLDESRDAFFPAAGGIGAITIHESFNSKWLATFRGRLGWLVNPAVLIYGTGGLAVANVDTTDSAFFAASGTNNTVSESTTRAGWTVGGGVEWRFAPQWSVKAEYLYVDLGSFSTTSANSNPALFPLATIDHDHHLTENIGRVGVNFHF